MKPTQRDFETAVAQMTILRYFPAESIGRAMVMDLLARMVGTAEQLNWLTRTLIDRVGEWQGPAQLRGLFCTRFKPADGIEGPTCTIAGFTPADSETAWLNAPEQRYLPAPDDTRGTEKERGLIEAVAKKLKIPDGRRIQ
jgi:hypothetical protein